MDIDVGASSNKPGTGPTYPVNSKFKWIGPMYLENVPANSGTAPAHPGTALSVPGTLQPMEIDSVLAEMMIIEVAVFTVRVVPSWA
jgi:hypothetical protein